MSTNKRIVSRLCLGLLLVALGSVLHAQELLPTRAGTTIINGINDGSEADGPGEMSITISSVVTWMPAESLAATDTVVVDTGYAFSSIESLDVDTSNNATSYDTVYIRYWLQNYGNAASDSFYFLANIVDTSDASHFTPTDFDLCNDTVGVDGLVGSAVKDSAWWKFALAEGSTDTILIRAVIPAPDSAADLDTIKIAVQVKDRNGTGTQDNWPGLSGTDIQRVVIDTGGVYYHTHNDSIWDYGDTQYDTIFIAVGGPRLRLKKTTILTSATQLPGDTLDYTIYYDNDGSAATEDTAFLIDQLPLGVAFLETLETSPGEAAAGISTYLKHGAIWLDHIPGAVGVADSVRDSLLRVTALKFAIAPGVAADNGLGDTDDPVANDSTDTDAGMIKFRVRIR